MKRFVLLAVSAALFCGTSVIAGNPSSFNDLPPGPAMQSPSMVQFSSQESQLGDRLFQLEAETQALRDEIAVLRSQPIQAAAYQGSQVVQASTYPNSYQADPPQYFTMEELRSEMAKYAWKKGDFTITPYGILWANFAYETQRTTVGDFNLFVNSPDDVDHDAFQANARATRLGVNIGGPCVPFLGCHQSGGKIEIDFHGDFVNENQPGVQLRHGYWEAKSDRHRFVLGQTWDVISPLNPHTLMYSVNWGAGNIGFRRAQIRYERFMPCSNRLLITAQGSMNADLVRDSAIAGDHAGWPVLEGRLATTMGLRGKNCLPITLGFSGHVGEQRADFAGGGTPHSLVPTYSFNVDFKMPITQDLGFQGEFFTGSNLGTYFGGVLQGIDGGSEDGIRSNGGWGELYWNWCPQMHSACGFSIDDPNNADLSSGRLYNHTYYANISWDLNKHLMCGFEVAQWKTLWVGKQPGDSTVFGFVSKYSF